MSEEQALTPQESTAISSAPDVPADEHAQLVAMVDAAMAQEASATGAAPPPAEAKPAAEAPAAPPAPPTEPDLPALTAAIRAREQARKTIDDSKAEAQRIYDDTVAKARAEADRIASEMRSKFEAEQRSWRERMRSNPLEAIKESGLGVDELVADVAREGSPEWRMLKAEQARRTQLEQKYEALEKWKTEQESLAKQNEQLREQQFREQRYKEFESLASAEKAPGVRAIAEQAHKLLGQYFPALDSPTAWLRAMGDSQHAYVYEKTGQGVANLSDLIQHMEHLARGHAARPAANGTSAVKSVAGNAMPGPRTLSASAASERRAAPKRSWDMTEEELRQAAIADVEEEMRRQKP